LELSRPCLGLRKGVAEVLEAEKTPKHKVNTKIHPLLRCNLALDPLGMSLECLALTSSTVTTLLSGPSRWRTSLTIMICWR
ncbi:hypothetical protein CLOP_g17730, partial [Closterium sp. NIES-67]